MMYDVDFVIGNFSTGQGNYNIYFWTGNFVKNYNWDFESDKFWRESKFSLKNIEFSEFRQNENFVQNNAK